MKKLTFNENGEAIDEQTGQIIGKKDSSGKLVFDTEKIRQIEEANKDNHNSSVDLSAVSRNDEPEKILRTSIKPAPKYTKYEISPLFLAQTKVQSPTTLKTIEPHRLKALILEDLRFYPNSSVAEMATRLPDVVYAELEKVVRNMAKKEEIKPIGGRKYRRYSLK